MLDPINTWAKQKSSTILLGVEITYCRQSRIFQLTVYQDSIQIKPKRQITSGWSVLWNNEVDGVKDIFKKTCLETLLPSTCGLKIWGCKENAGIREACKALTITNKHSGEWRSKERSPQNGQPPWRWSNKISSSAAVSGPYNIAGPRDGYQCRTAFIQRRKLPMLKV